MKTSNRKSPPNGITLVEILFVVAIIGLIASIVIPSFVNGRKASQKNACIANLKQIDGAKALWAENQKATNGAPVSVENLYGLHIGTLQYIKEPHCPAGGLYDTGNIGQPARYTLGASRAAT